MLEEGEYVCPKTTVFGLTREEVATLIENGFKVHDKHPDKEGQEVESSGYNVSLQIKKHVRIKSVIFWFVFQLMRHLGLLFGFAPLGNPLKTDLKIEDTKKPRMSMMATLARDIA